MEMDLVDRIKSIEEYRPDITYKDGYMILKIKYKKGWNVIEPDTDEIAHDICDAKTGCHIYVTLLDNTDKLFSLIEETVEVNKTMEKKVLLFNDKVKELQSMFLSDLEYDKLATIQFTFPDDTRKKKGIKQKKNESKAESYMIENITAATADVSEGCESEIDRKIKEAVG